MTIKILSDPPSIRNPRLYWDANVSCTNSQIKSVVSKSPVNAGLFEELIGSGYITPGKPYFPKTMSGRNSVICGM